MAIESDEELEAAITEASALLQEIQNYVRRDFSKKAKVRFPRGFLRTAAEMRRRLTFLPRSALKANISYTMMLSDVQHWLLVRTDISGTAKEMIIKLQVVLLGSIIESMTKAYLRGSCGGGYKRRTEYLEQNGIISKALRQDLDWLWDIRNRIHLFGIDSTEWLSNYYTVSSHNRAGKAFRGLLEALDARPVQARSSHI